MAAGPRIRLIGWDRGEAPAKVSLLQAVGYAVEAGPMSAAVLRALREAPPTAVVIDLDRQPSSGRDLALNLRQHKRTRHVPLVLAGGEPDRVAALRALLPDATYTPWSEIVPALARALEVPAADLVVPGSVFAAYAGVPLARKLGIQPGFRVCLIDAPGSIETALAPLPEGATLLHDPAGPRDLTVWFIRSRSDLGRGLPAQAPHAARGRLWIAWPKKASAVETDLTQRLVRQLGLAAGLMDYKVCSLDATWTGLRFTQAGARRPGQRSPAGPPRP